MLKGYYDTYDKKDFNTRQLNSVNTIHPTSQKKKKVKNTHKQIPLRLKPKNIVNKPQVTKPSHKPFVRPIINSEYHHPIFHLPYHSPPLINNNAKKKTYKPLFHRVRRLTPAEKERRRRMFFKKFFGKLFKQKVRYNRMHKPFRPSFKHRVIRRPLFFRPNIKPNNAKPKFFKKHIIRIIPNNKSKVHTIPVLNKNSKKKPIPLKAFLEKVERLNHSSSDDDSDNLNFIQRPKTSRGFSFAQIQKQNSNANPTSKAENKATSNLNSKRQNNKTTDWQERKENNGKIIKKGKWSEVKAKDDNNEDFESSSFNSIANDMPSSHDHKFVSHDIMADHMQREKNVISHFNSPSENNNLYINNLSHNIEREKHQK